MEADSAPRPWYWRPGLGRFCVQCMHYDSRVSCLGAIIAPQVGCSLYTWTSVIGVILAGMSLGNYLGGRLADPIRIAAACLARCLRWAGIASLGVWVWIRWVSRTSWSGRLSLRFCC